VLFILPPNRLLSISGERTNSAQNTRPPQAARIERTLALGPGATGSDGPARRPLRWRDGRLPTAGGEARRCSTRGWNPAHSALENRNSLGCAERSSVCECRDCVNPNSEDSIDIVEEFSGRNCATTPGRVQAARRSLTLTNETMAPARAPRWKARANIQVDFLRSNV
jgi:hypothetical protein